MLKNKVILLIISIALAIWYFNGPGAGKYNNLFGNTIVAFAQENALGKPGVQVMRLQGQFKPEDYIEDGLPTIIEFSYDKCPNCAQLNNSHLPRFLPLRPDVAVIILKLPDRWSTGEISRDHGIRVDGTPFIMVYGPDGELLASDERSGNEGHDFLFEWMNFEIQKDYKRRQNI